MSLSICPCENIVPPEKLQAVKEIIKHPSGGVLDTAQLTRKEYELLLPTAVSSLTGVHRASAQAPREDFVRRFLRKQKEAGLVRDFQDMTRQPGRFDFKVKTPSDRTIVIDVKGGEGNSVTLSDRPKDCHEFVVWCHLTGSLQRKPGEQARAIISRLLKVMLNRSEQSKRYDVLVIWDVLCGTKLRPCPHARGRVMPCVVLFPQVQATKTSPRPPIHTLDSTEMPALIFDYTQVKEKDCHKHVWQTFVELNQEGTRWMRSAVIRNLYTGEEVVLPRTACNPLDVPAPTP